MTGEERGTGSNDRRTEEEGGEKGGEEPESGGKKEGREELNKGAVEQENSNGVNTTREEVASSFEREEEMADEGMERRGHLRPDKGDDQERKEEHRTPRSSLNSSTASCSGDYHTRGYQRIKIRVGVFTKAVIIQSNSNQSSNCNKVISDWCQRITRLLQH